MKALHDHGADAYYNRYAHAVEHGRKHVATLGIRTQQKFGVAVRHPDRRHFRVHQVHGCGVVRIVRSDKGSAETDDNQKSQYDDAGNSHGITNEAVKEIGIPESVSPYFLPEIRTMGLTIP